jgi:alpha-D-xyloside xylohydrolase
LRFGTPERFTPEKFRELAPELAGLERLPSPGPLPIELEKIRCRVASSRTVVYIPCDEPKDEIYGFGLDPACYRQKGLRKRLTISACKIGQTGASHGPVPFYISTKGYGIYVDTARVPFVHVARLSPAATAIDGAGGHDDEDLKTSVRELYAAVEASSRPEVVFDLPGNNTGVNVFVFAGPTLREVVQRFNLFSGGGCMPPMWGLGLKYRTYTGADQRTASEHARGLRKWGIPADMFGFEPGWQTEAYSCSLVWSDKRFPDYSSMLAELNSKGFKVNLWEHAYIHPTSPLFEKLLGRSGDYLVWGGLVVDFADPQAFKIFAEYHESYLVDQGVSGFKADECDRQPISDCTPFNYPYCSRFPSGIDGDQMTQLYGFLYQRSIHSIFRRKNRRTWGDARATTALAAPLPFCLYSDAYTFDEYLRQLLNASFAGLLWSPEVRNAGSLEEYLNRLALSSFAPQMCLDAWSVPNPPWMQYDPGKNKRNELLSEAEQTRVAGLMAQIVNLRMRLLPYLYSCFYKYRVDGLPPVRSLLMDFPEDHKLRDVDDEFLFGDNLLVAPFLGSSSLRSVYFPTGCHWICFHTQKRYQGGTKAVVEGNPGEIPVFVRENTLLPLAEPVQFVAPDEVFDVIVQVYGDKPERFVMFEDDGVSFDYEDGAFNSVFLSWSDGKGTVERRGNYAVQRYHIADWDKIELHD